MSLPDSQRPGIQGATKLAAAAALAVAGIEETLSATRSRASTGVVCGRTTRWNGFCAKCGEELEPSAHFRTRNQR